MKPFMSSSLFLAVALLSTVAPAAPEREKAPPVSLPRTEALTVQANDGGLTCQLHIALPHEYGTPGQTYPVIYLLDSDIHFGFVRSLAESLHLSGDLTAAIVVGIGYGEDDLARWSRNRDRDFLVAPRPGPAPGDSGNASRFLAFLQGGIIPRIEARYPVRKGDRTLMGMSAGAVFAAHVLATCPDTFQRYIIVSPYLVAGQEQLIAQAAAKNRQDIRAMVYTAMGDSELGTAGPGWQELFGHVRQRLLPGFRLQQEVIDRATHFEMAYSAYPRGIKSVFGGRPAPYKAIPENYPRLCGGYFLSLAGFPVVVDAEGGKLFARLGPSRAELVPSGETRFIAPAIPGWEFSFLPGDDTRSPVLILRQMGFDMAAWKMAQAQ
jgi:predicted alpha/beta superfamily hydrolase